MAERGLLNQAAARIAAVKIVMATSEAVPFAKTGGLADVCGALPVELARLGHEVTVIMPAYRSVAVMRACRSSRPGIDLTIPSAARWCPGDLLESTFPGSNVPVYFVDQPDYFDRDELYQVRRQGLSRQLRAVRLLQPRRAGGDPPAWT